MNSRNLWSFLVILSTSFLSLQAADLEGLRTEYQKLLQDMGPEREQAILQVLNRWAPEYFQATTIKKSGEKFQVPAYDVPVSPFFDGDMNIKNNAAHLDGRKMKLEIIPTFKETETHYFLAFIKYHAKDVAPIGGHDHDAESVWMSIRKDGTATGTLEWLATCRHGLPSFYSPDPELEAHLKARFTQLKKENKVRVKFVDSFSGLSPSAVRHEEGHFNKHGTNFFPIVIYSEEGKHALSICDSGLLKNVSEPLGIRLACEKTGIPDEVDPLDIRPEPYGYSLVLLDKLINELYLNADDQAKIKRRNIFEESKLSISGSKFENSFGELESREGLPTTWAKGETESSAEANFNWDMRLVSGADVFSQPHRVLELMYGGLPSGLAEKYKIGSSNYLFNPMLKVLRISPTIKTNSVQNCLTNSWERNFQQILKQQ